MHNTLIPTGGGNSNVLPKRDSAPEIYRVALMFGICFLHCMTQGGYNTPWLANIFLSCVDGFVFITGYYGLTFRPSKVINLYTIAICSGSIALVATQLFLFPLSVDIKCLRYIGRTLYGGWFLNAYVFLMLLAPMIDAVLTHCPKRYLASAFVPFALLAFGWNFGQTLPFIGSVLPKTAGLGDYTGLTLLSVYVVVRFCRIFEIGRFFTWKRAILLLATLWTLTGIGFGDYSSPFAVALSATMFYAFKRIPWHPWIGKIASILGPSTFSIYLMHSNYVGFTFIKHAERTLVEAGWNIFLIYFVVALTIFLGCTTLDIPRRLLAMLFRPILKRFHTSLDSFYFRLISTKLS